MWLRWKRIRNVVEDARRVLKLQPDNRKLHRQLPRWLVFIGDFEDAESECQRFLAKWPNDPWVLYIRALLRQRQGRIQEAADILDPLVREYHEFPEGYVLRGTLYLDAGHPKDAIPWFRRALQFEGIHRREALYELSRALNQIGQTKEAEQAMAEARLMQ